MTTETTNTETNPEGEGGHAAEPSYLEAKTGLKSWLITIDHKRIGIMYLLSVLVFFLAGGTFALLLRTELLTPTKLFIEADTTENQSGTCYALRDLSDPRLSFIILFLCFLQAFSTTRAAPVGRRSAGSPSFAAAPNSNPASRACQF